MHYVGGLSNSGKQILMVYLVLEIKKLYVRIGAPVIESIVTLWSGRIVAIERLLLARTN